jgi:acetyl esterase/lipase
MKSILSFLFIILLGLSGSSCRKENDPEVQAKEQLKYDIRYGSYKENKLDLYLPANRDRNTPFVVLIHGGGWIAGDKNDMRFLQRELIARGIASVSVDYRLASDKVHYEDIMEDVSAAVNYCFYNHSDWNIRTDKFLIAGSSAGGHLALLYAYRYNTEGRVAAVISMSGPTDFTREEWLNQNIDYYIDGLSLFQMSEKMIGADYVPGQPLDPRFVEASPRFYAKNIPTLLLHGTNDAIVPVTQSQLLSDDLTSVGFTQKLVLLNGSGHDLSDTGSPNYLPMLTEIENWCTTYGR